MFNVVIYSIDKMGYVNRAGTLENRKSSLDAIAELSLYVKGWNSAASDLMVHHAECIRQHDGCSMWLMSFGLERAT